MKLKFRMINVTDVKGEILGMLSVFMISWKCLHCCDHARERNLLGRTFVFITLESGGLISTSLLISFKKEVNCQNPFVKEQIYMQLIQIEFVIILEKFCAAELMFGLVELG